jgi:hypothetical protein
VNGFELIHRSHARELEGIVFVGFAFDVTPLASVFVGGADESFQAVAAARSSIQPEGPHASMTTRSILWFMKRVLR